MPASFLWQELPVSKTELQPLTGLCGEGLLEPMWLRVLWLVHSLSVFSMLPPYLMFSSCWAPPCPLTYPRPSEVSLGSDHPCVWGGFPLLKTPSCSTHAETALLSHPEQTAHPKWKGHAGLTVYVFTQLGAMNTAENPAGLL